MVADAARRRQWMPASGLLIWSPLLTAAFVGSSLAIGTKQLCAHGSFPFARATVRSLDFVPLPSRSTTCPRCCQSPRASGPFRLTAALAASAVVVWSILAAQTLQSAWVNCALGWTLATLTWIDAFCFVLPDLLTLPLVLTGLGVTLATVQDAAFWPALGAAVGYLALPSIALAYRALRHRKGLAGGDAKLFAAAGAWLGIGVLSLSVMVAAMTALACACLVVIAGRLMRATTAAPYGLFPAAAC